MAPDEIVEAVDVAANGLVGFLAGVEDGAPDELGFEGLEERLHHGVVVAISLAGHRDQDAVFLEGPATPVYRTTIARSSAWKVADFKSPADSGRPAFPTAAAACYALQRLHFNDTQNEETSSEETQCRKS